jgi:hypothetical protein
MNLEPVWPHAALLPDGRVLVTSYPTHAAEIYDPATDTFKKLADAPVSGANPVRLRDGTVLLLEDAYSNGGGGAALFDPDTEIFTPLGPMAQKRAQFTAHTIPDGRVVIIGGEWQPATDTIEIFDPATRSFAMAPYRLTRPRGWHGSALVRDGTILVLGGYDNGCTPSDTVDQIDPVRGVVTPFAPLPRPNTEMNGLTLADGTALGVGGGSCGSPNAVADLNYLPGDE